MEIIQTKVTGSVSFQACVPRYVLKVVNYTPFIYDRQDDVYIPAQVFSEIAGDKMEKIPKARR